MKRALFAASLAFFSPAVRAEVSVRIVQPYEDAKLPNVKSSFVFGSVSPASATLTLNGQPVKPHTNGAFLAMIPFSEGAFQIQAHAELDGSSATAVRVVTVAPEPKSNAVDHPTLEPWSPPSRVVVRPGDVIDVAFRGATGGTATFRLGGRGPLAMMEQGGRVNGIYKGVYVVQPDDRFENQDVHFTLRRRDGRTVSARANSKISVRRSVQPAVAELKDDAVVLTGPAADMGYALMPVKGTRFETVGEWGDFTRVLFGSDTGWVRTSQLSPLPPATPAAKSVSFNARVDVSTTGSTLVSIPLQARHPFRIEQFTAPARLRLSLYGVVADTDRIRYRVLPSLVREILWHQAEPTVCEFDIVLQSDDLWGYDARYDGTTLVLELRPKPAVSGGRTGYLKGLVIAVDAGHSRMNFGTIGPMGTTEADLCLRVAQDVKAELEKRGATVVMPQDGTKELTLTDRVRIAWESRSHLFISIHADACPEGQNPRQVEGFSVHYYHPLSRRWAETLHRVYGEKTGIRDQGVWRSNLAVCRTPQMPALLLEQGFLMLPEMEERFNGAAHRRQVSDAVVSSILELLRARP